MERFGDLGDAETDCSSAGSEHSADVRANKPISLVRLPSMYSPESKSSPSSRSSQNEISSQASNDNAVDFDQLPVSNEIKGLFPLIDNYDPIELDLETPLKCFLPSYFPAVGGVDPFVKIPRPDGVPDGIGTALLDEPILAKQSNAAVIELRLRNHFKIRSSKDTVHSINNVSENRKVIDEWIDNVDELHTMRPHGEVKVHNKMPTMQELVQAWPEEMDTEVRNGSVELPGAEIDLTVEEYARMTCALLGIPIYNDCVVESVHTMVKVFLETQSSDSSLLDEFEMKG